MSFGGSVSAMLTSLKNNKVRLREPQRTDHFEYVKGVPIGKPLKYKGSISEEELKEMRTLMTRRLQREKRMIFLSYSVIIIGAIIAILIFL